jgi:opacity protein-like surface antigen
MGVAKVTAGLLAGGMLLAATAASAEPYVRIGGGWDWSTNAVFSDRDCNAVPTPYPLYGCGPGINGEPLGAYGNFGSSPNAIIGFGVRVLPALRLEAEVAYRPGFAFDGEANFVKTDGDQLVDAPVTSLTAMALAYVDLGPLASHERINPFVGFGIGAAWNTIDPMYFDFPGEPPPNYSITPGGSTRSLAYAVTAGAGIELTERLTLDLAWRLTDHGRVATEVGDLISQRGGGVFLILIDETHARLWSNGFGASLRVGF